MVLRDFTMRCLIGEDVHRKCLKLGTAILIALWHAVCCIEFADAARSHSTLLQPDNIPPVRENMNEDVMSLRQIASHVCPGWCGTEDQAQKGLALARTRATKLVETVARQLTGINQDIVKHVVVPISTRLVVMTGSESTDVDYGAKLLARSGLHGGNLPQVCRSHELLMITFTEDDTVRPARAMNLT